MNLETKIGLFVLLGLALSGVGVMKLSDVRLEKRYTLYFIFADVQSLREKSPVKIAGVEIGQAEKIELSEGRAKVTARILKNVAVYANAAVKVSQTGFIGTQYLDLHPGTPEARRLEDGDTIYGEQTKSVSDLLDKLTELLEGKNGKPGIGDDLKATMANLRQITDSLNAAIGKQKGEMVDMVNNFHQFSSDMKGVAGDLHEITSSRKEDIEAAMTRLKGILDKVDDLLARVQRGEGTIGKLVNDKEMGEDVKKSVSNLKDTSASAKEVLARFTKIRSFWEFQLRSVPGANTTRGDAGIRLQPRDHKYYYIGINNAGLSKDEFGGGVGDWERKNTITAVLGKDFGPATFELGAIRSRAGVGIKYYPFRDNIQEDEPNSWLRGIELKSQAFDFGRDEVLGNADSLRRFKGPQVNVGLSYRVRDWISLGGSVEDLTEIRQYNVNTNLAFEDKDIAYLFGFVSFAR